MAVPLPGDLRNVSRRISGLDCANAAGAASSVLRVIMTLDYTAPRGVSRIWGCGAGAAGYWTVTMAPELTFDSSTGSTVFTQGDG